MKIAFFTDTFLPAINGVVVSILDFSSYLVDHGHQVIIFAPQAPDLEELNSQVNPKVEICLVPGINAQRLYPDHKLALTNLKLINTFREFNPDVVHTHTPLSLGFQGMLLAKRFNKPLVTTYHTNVSDKDMLKAFPWLNPTIGSPLQKGVTSVINNFLHRHDLIIAPTLDTLHDLQKNNLGDKSVVIPSPVPVHNLIHNKSLGQQKRKLLSLPKSLIFVGRLSGEKNIDQILEIMTLVLPSLPDLKLVLVGDGNQRKRLTDLSFELGISESVVWVGRVEHDELIEQGLYYLGDIFVTMSCFETQGLSTIEAMACGLPIVAANARGSKYLVTNNGFLVEPGDVKAAAKKIIQIFEDKTLKKELSQASTKAAQQFSPVVVGAKLVAAYQSLL